MIETNKIIIGDALETVKTFPDESVDCVITSPPYYQLRHYEGIPDYTWDGDKGCQHDWNVIERKPTGGRGDNANVGANKNATANMRDGSVYSNICNKCGAWKGQLGLEPTYQMYLNHLLQIMSELKRVLKPTGTMWINLGDTYGSFRGERYPDKFHRENNIINESKHYKGAPDKNWGIEKCLLLIPHRFAIRCVDELGLILRNDVIWAKRNGMPESVTDRFSKKHEFFFFFVKQQKYYFDLDGVRDKCTDQERLTRRLLDPNNNDRMYKRGEDGTKAFGINPKSAEQSRLNMIEKGKNPGSVSDFWDIPTQPSSDKHYATYNFDLIDKPIIAGCPKDGIILDPFCGTGTTITRAIQLDRQGIGIDGSEEYCKIAEQRVFDELAQLKLAL